MAKTRNLQFEQIPIEQAKAVVRRKRAKIARVGEDTNQIASHMWLRSRLDTIEGKLDAVLRAVQKPNKQST